MSSRPELMDYVAPWQIVHARRCKRAGDPVELKCLGMMHTAHGLKLREHDYQPFHSFVLRLDVHRQKGVVTLINIEAIETLDQAMMLAGELELQMNVFCAYVGCEGRR